MSNLLRFYFSSTKIKDCIFLLKFCYEISIKMMNYFVRLLKYEKIPSIGYKYAILLVF